MLRIKKAQYPTKTEEEQPVNAAPPPVVPEIPISDENSSPQHPSPPPPVVTPPSGGVDYRRNGQAEYDGGNALTVTFGGRDQWDEMTVSIPLEPQQIAELRRVFRFNK